MATNGYFANVLGQIKSLEAQLANLNASALKVSAEQKAAQKEEKSGDLKKRKPFSNIKEEENEANNGVSTPLGSNEIETADVKEVSEHPLTHASNPDIAKVASEINELKSHITSQGPAKISYPNNVTLGNFLDYLLVPTLVYELEYPRTEKVRLWYVIEKTLATFGTFYILCR